jgi:MarR family 2-MHQ and catechol resistance regulon transcriptional repressor
MKTTKRYGKKAESALGLWVKLARAYHTFARHTAADIRASGLTQPQFGALESLGHLGPMQIGELCRKQLVSGGNMTVVVDNLEKDGLVERVPHAEDRRAIIVRLTAKGKKVFEDSFPKHAQYVTKIASVLTEEEQAELSQLLKKLGTGLQ